MGRLRRLPLLGARGRDVPVHRAFARSARRAARPAPARRQPPRAGRRGPRDARRVRAESSAHGWHSSSLTTTRTPGASATRRSTSRAPRGPRSRSSSGSDRRGAAFAAPRRGRWPMGRLVEDAVSTGADEEADDDQHDAEEDVALKELDDASDDEDDGDDPEQEGHSGSPFEVRRPRGTGVVRRARDRCPDDVRRPGRYPRHPRSIPRRVGCHTCSTTSSVRSAANSTAPTRLARSPSSLARTGVSGDRVQGVAAQTDPRGLQQQLAGARHVAADHDHAGLSRFTMLASPQPRCRPGVLEGALGARRSRRARPRRWRPGPRPAAARPSSPATVPVEV